MFVEVCSHSIRAGLKRQVVSSLVHTRAMKEAARPLAPSAAPGPAAPRSRWSAILAQYAPISWSLVEDADSTQRAQRASRRGGATKADEATALLLQSDRVNLVARSFVSEQIRQAALIVGFVAIYLLAGAAIFATAEGWPFFDSFYFAVVTVSVRKAG